MQPRIQSNTAEVFLARKQHETDIMDLDAELKRLALFSKELQLFCREHYDGSKARRLLLITLFFYALGMLSSPTLDHKTGQQSSLAVSMLSCLTSMIGSMISHALFSFHHAASSLPLTQTTSSIREKTEAFFPDMLLSDRICDLDMKLQLYTSNQFNLLQKKLEVAPQHGIQHFLNSKPHFTYLKAATEATLKDTTFLYNISMAIPAGLALYLMLMQDEPLKQALKTIVTESGKTCAELYLPDSHFRCNTPVDESACVSACTNLFDSTAHFVPLFTLAMLSGAFAFVQSLLTLEQNWNYVPIQKIPLPELKSGHSPSLFKRFVCRSKKEVVDISARVGHFIGM